MVLITNPVNDLIIRIKNAYMSKADYLNVPYSVFKEKIAKKLQEIGFIKSVVVEGDTKKTLRIELLYVNNKPALTDVKIFSKPGRRWYVGHNEIKKVLGGLGYSLLSTPKGLLTGREAKKQKIGGELLFYVW